MLDIRDRILRELRAERDSLAAAVASGASSTFEDYKFQVGQIRAFDRACDLVVESFQRYDTEDEDGHDSFPV